MGSGQWAGAVGSGQGAELDCIGLRGEASTKRGWWASGKVAKRWPPWLFKVAKSWQRCQGLCVVNVALWYSREIGSHNRLASKQLRYGRDNARGGQMAQSIALSLGTLNRAFLNHARQGHNPTTLHTHMFVTRF